MKINSFFKKKDLRNLENSFVFNCKGKFFYLNIKKVLVQGGLMDPILRASNGGLFQNVLDQIADEVDAVIQQATNNLEAAGIELEIQAGEEITRIIGQIESAYNKELNYTVDKISKEAKIALDNLNSILQQFQKGLDTDIQKILSNVQQLANTLPFTNKQAQLTAVKPRYLVIDDIAKSSLVMFQGNFFYAANPGYTPKLTFQGQDCYLIDFNTQSLTFQVPHDSFSNVPPKQYSFKTGELSVFWDDAGWIWSTKVESKFCIGLGAIPKTAGAGSAEYVSTATVRNTEHFKANYKFNGSEFYPEHWHTCIQQIFPKDGWKIDKSTVVMTPHHEHGDHNQKIDVYIDRVVLTVNLYCKDGHDMGIVNIDIDFDEYQDQTVQNTRTENFEMTWEGSSLLKPQPNETISKVIFTDYKGITDEYGSPDITRGVLKSTAQGSSWRIWCEPPVNVGLKKTELPKKVQEEIEKAERIQRLNSVRK